MPISRRPRPEEVEHLLRNAQLRDDLEPHLDEALRRVNVLEMPTPAENEYLESMLAWERAPVEPISRWFDPEMTLPHPDSLDDERIHACLWEVIRHLQSKRIMLDFSDHLPDRDLYWLIFRDILPAREKRIDSPKNYLHWDCANVSGDPQVWLRYYASAEERHLWQLETGGRLPSSERPPFPRAMPRRPLWPATR